MPAISVNKEPVSAIDGAVNHLREWRRPRQLRCCDKGCCCCCCCCFDSGVVFAVFSTRITVAVFSRRCPSLPLVPFLVHSECTYFNPTGPAFVSTLAECPHTSSLKGAWEPENMCDVGCGSRGTEEKLTHSYQNNIACFYNE